DVKVEGKNVPRLFDPMGQNEGSVANANGPALLQPPATGAPVAAAAPAATILTAAVVKVEFKSKIKLWSTDVKNKKDEEAPPSGKPHWKTGGTSYPACYVREGASGTLTRKLEVTVEITTNLTGDATLVCVDSELEVESKSQKIYGQ